MIVAHLLNRISGIKIKFYDRNDMSKTTIDYDRMNGFDYKEFAHRKVYMVFFNEETIELEVALY